MQKEKTPHPHAAMIAEWIQDTSRVVEFFGVFGEWIVPAGDPSWAPNIKYRFADAVKPVIVSSLSDAELRKLQSEHPEDSCAIDNIRNIANAAAARAIEELPLLECSMNGRTVQDVYIQSGGGIFEGFEAVVIAVRDDYIKQVKAGKK